MRGQVEPGHDRRVHPCTEEAMGHMTEQTSINPREACDHDCVTSYMVNEEGDPCAFCKDVAEYSCNGCGALACDFHLREIDQVAAAAETAAAL